jgi:hypothetical protein
MKPGHMGPSTNRPARTTGEIARDPRAPAPPFTTGEHQRGHLGKTGDRYFKTQEDARTGQPKHGDPWSWSCPNPVEPETFDALQQALDRAPGPASDRTTSSDDCR